MADTSERADSAAELQEERPLFSYSFELSNQLVSDMATVLAGDSKRNPPTIACATLLAVIVLIAASPMGRDNTPLLIGLVIVEMAMWTLSRRWVSFKVNALRKDGYDTALVPKGERRRAVELYDDRVVVRPEGETARTLLVSSMRKPRYASDLLVLVFSGGHYVPVPRKALSTTRFSELVRHVAKVTGTKVDE